MRPHVHTTLDGRIQCPECPALTDAQTLRMAAGWIARTMSSSFTLQEALMGIADKIDTEEFRRMCS